MGFVDNKKKVGKRINKKRHTPPDNLHLFIFVYCMCLFVIIKRMNKSQTDVGFYQKLDFVV